MTNYEKWKCFMADVSSPEDFVDIGFYFLIAAALQRRVWLGPPERPIFPNMNVVLCGLPGVGKGEVIKPVNHLLKFHKLSGNEADASKGENVLKIDTMIEKAKRDNLDPTLIEALYNSKDAVVAANAANQKEEKKERLLIPVAPESTTCEMLTQIHAASMSKMNVTACKMAPNGFYGHWSLAVVLEEMSSLFKKRTHDIANYFIVAYDCGDYTYATKNAGTDKIRKSCLSFLAGTQPSFIKSTFDDKLLGEGFSSRTFFIWGEKTNKHRFIYPPLTSEQLNAERDLLHRIRELSTLFGQVTYAPDALEYLENYMRETFPSIENAGHDVLKPYYARMNQHLMKISLVGHFAENNDYTISLTTAKWATTFAERIQKNMHKCLVLTGRNTLAPVYEKVLRYISKCESGAKMIDIWQKFVGDFQNFKEVTECMEFLQTGGKIEGREQNKEMRYYIKTKSN